MRVVYSDMREIIIKDLQGETDPKKRLTSIVEGNFDPAIFTRANAYIWISYVPRVPFNPVFQRLQGVIERRLRSNIVVECKRINPDKDGDVFFREMMALIGSYWLRLGIGNEDIETLRQGALERAGWMISDL